MRAKEIVEKQFRSKNIEDFKPSNDALDDLKSKYLSDWEMLDHKTMQAKYVAKDHRHAEQFVSWINRLSEKMDHFAEVTQDVAEVTVKTTTFDVKGLTILDFQLAIYVDAYAEKNDIEQVRMSGNFGMHENFADGRNPQDAGDSARYGIPKNATIGQLEKIRSSDSASSRKKQLAHWQINMRRGKKDESFVNAPGRLGNLDDANTLRLRLNSQFKVNGTTLDETVANIIDNLFAREPSRTVTTIAATIDQIIRTFRLAVDKDHRIKLARILGEDPADLDIAYKVKEEFGVDHMDLDRKKAIIADFIKWAAPKIHLKTVPKITFSDDQAEAEKHHHTGSYDWHNNTLWVYVGNRNLVDIIRTLCHELVHAKQDQANRIRRHSPPGSKLEREADETAGYLLKLYGAKNNDIFQ